MNKVGAVVVAFNEIEELKNLLNCLQNQSYQIDFLVIIDNSIDAIIRHEIMILSELCNSFNIIYISTIENIGSAGGFALGMQIALEQGADLIWLNDQDGRPEKTCLLKMVNSFNQINSLSILCPLIIDENKNILKDFQLKLNFLGRPIPINNTRQFQEIDCAGTTGILINKDVLNKIGIYDYQNFFVGYEDYEYCFRAKKLGSKIYTINDAIYVHPNLDEKYNKRKRIYLDKYFPQYLGKLTTDFSKRKIFEIHSLRFLSSKYLSRPLYLMVIFYSFFRVLIEKLFIPNVNVWKTLNLYFTSSFRTSQSTYFKNRPIKEYIQEFKNSSI